MWWKWIPRISTFSIGVVLLEGVWGGQVLQLEEHVKKLEDHLHVVGGLDQHVHHLLANGPINDVTCGTRQGDQKEQRPLSSQSDSSNIHTIINVFEGPSYSQITAGTLSVFGWTKLASKDRSLKEQIKLQKRKCLVLLLSTVKTTTWWFFLSGKRVCQSFIIIIVITSCIVLTVNCQMLADQTLHSDCLALGLVLKEQVYPQASRAAWPPCPSADPSAPSVDQSDWNPTRKKEKCPYDDKSAYEH